MKPTQRGRFFVTLTELKKGKVGVGKEGISCLRLGYQRPEKIAGRCQESANQAQERLYSVPANILPKRDSVCVLQWS